MNEPLWMTMSRDMLGLGEIVGGKHEPKVVGFFAEAGVPEIRDDETAWCGAFLRAMFVKAQRPDVKPPGDRYNALRARAWLNVGTAVDRGRPGDIVVFERGGKNATTGHVAFFVEDAGENIKVLGGNQSNKVSIATYAKSRLLGYRRIAPLAEPAQPAKPAPAPVPPAPSPRPPVPLPRSGLARFIAKLFPPRR